MDHNSSAFHQMTIRVVMFHVPCSMLHVPDDRLLIAQAQRGDARAYGALVQKYQGAVFAVCYRVLSNREEAEDRTQDAFIRAHSRLQTFDKNRPFLPWIRRVAVNVCLNHLEKHEPLKLELGEGEGAYDPPAPQSDPSEQHEAQDEASRLHAAVLALPPVYRLAIELRHFQELSYDEMAEIMQLPLNTIKSHLFRARKLLKERMVHEATGDKRQ